MDVFKKISVTAALATAAVAPVATVAAASADASQSSSSSHAVVSKGEHRVSSDTWPI